MSKNFDEALNKLTMEEVLARNAGEKVVADRLHNIRQLLIRDAQQGVQLDACYCCRNSGCQEGCRCWQLLPEESRR